MYTAIIVTSIDARRVGLSYKAEIPDWGFEEWFMHLDLANGRRAAHNRAADVRNPKGNTAITIVHPNGEIQSAVYDFTWDTLNEILARADYMGNGYEGDRKPGRPEKRVLVLTTSKERRTGSLVARQGY